MKIPFKIMYLMIDSKLIYKRGHGVISASYRQVESSLNSVLK